MKILGPDGNPLYIDGVAQFEERTCGECARLHELDELTGACHPPIPVWQLGGPTSARSKAESADGCECFAKRVTVEVESAEARG